MANFKIFIDNTETIHESFNKLIEKHKIDDENKPRGIITGEQFGTFSSLMFVYHEHVSRKKFNFEKQEIITVVDEAPTIKTANLISTHYDHIYLTYGPSAGVEILLELLNRVNPDKILVPVNVNIQHFMDWMQKNSDCEIKTFYLENFPVQDNCLFTGKFNQQDQSSINIDDQGCLHKLSIKLIKPAANLSINSKGEFSTKQSQLERIIDLIRDYFVDIEDSTTEPQVIKNLGDEKEIDATSISEVLSEGN